MTNSSPQHSPPSSSASHPDRELLLHDYAMCHAGYTSRDQLVAQEFSQLLHAFVLFLSVTSAARVLQPFNEKVTFFVVVLLAISGTSALIAYLINIEGKASSKKVLRKRMAVLENQLDPEELLHWKVITKRPKYPAEKIVKNSKSDRDEKGSASEFFVIAAYIIISVWFILVGLLLFFDQFIFFNQIP